MNQTYSNKQLYHLHKWPMYRLKCRNLCCNSQRVIGWILFESYHNLQSVVFYRLLQVVLLYLEDHPRTWKLGSPLFKTRSLGEKQRSPWAKIHWNRPSREPILQGLGSVASHLNSPPSPLEPRLSFWSEPVAPTMEDVCFLSNPNKEKTTTTTYKKRSNHCVWNGEICAFLGISRYDLCIQEFQTVTVGGQAFWEMPNDDAHLHQSGDDIGCAGVTWPCFEFLKLRRMIRDYLKPLPVIAIHSIKKAIHIVSKMPILSQIW